MSGPPSDPGPVQGRPLRVVVLMRQPLPRQYSIERVIESVLPHLPADVEAEVVRVPASRGALGRLRNLLFAARISADVVHVAGDIHYCALAIWRPKCVLTVLDTGTLHRLAGARRRVFKLVWFQLPIRRANEVTTISQAVMDELVSECPVAKGKVSVVHCSVGGDFSPSGSDRTGDGSFRLLQVGTNRNKNLERVIEAVTGLPVALRVVGVLTPDQRHMAASAGVDLVELGSVSEAELLDEYRGSDALIFASTFEGFGLPILEAQLCGLPVITSRRLSMPEVAGDGAVLVDPEDVEDIRRAICSLIADPALRRSLAERGRVNAERFAREAIAGRYAEVYRAAAALPAQSRAAGHALMTGGLQ